jgi:hypothetical protein
MYRARYLSIQDLDEFIVPLVADNWTEMVAGMKLKNPETVAALNFCNLFFPLGGPNADAYPNSSAVVRYNIEPLLKVNHNGYIYQNNVRSKVMVRPEKILGIHVHLVLEENMVNRETDVNFNVSKEVALLFHYRRWTIGKPDQPNHRFFHYSNEITSRVSRAVNKYLGKA